MFAKKGGHNTRLAVCQEAVVCCVVCAANPMCKLCFKHMHRKRFAGDLLNCRICKAYCHKDCGTVSENERRFWHGYVNFKCPACAEIELEVVPP